jgi:hypothetical protein
MSELFGIGPKIVYPGGVTEERPTGARQWLIILHFTFTSHLGYTILSYPTSSKEWILHVLRRFDIEKQGDCTEALVVNRRFFHRDVQASDWDDGQKQLQKCLRHYTKSRSRQNYSPPITCGIVAIFGYAKFYEYHLEERSLIPSISGNPALHIGLKCSTIQSLLNQIKAKN